MQAITEFLDGSGWPENRIAGYYGFSYVTLMWRDIDPVTYKFDYRSSTGEVTCTVEDPQEASTPAPNPDEDTHRKSMIAMSNLSDVQEVITMTGLAQNDVGSDSIRKINLVKKLILDDRAMNESITESELNKMMED